MTDEQDIVERLRRRVPDGFSPIDASLLYRAINPDGPEAASLIERLRREVEEADERYDALAKGEWEKVYLLSAGPDYGSRSFEIILRTGVGAAMAACLCEMLKSVEGAENYITVSVAHPDMGPLSLTVQRERGETPASKAARLQTELDELRQSLAKEARHD